MSWAVRSDTEAQAHEKRAAHVPRQPAAGTGRKDTSLWQANRERRLFPDLVESLRTPEFWALSAWLDIVVTYRRSRLGAIWLLMPSVVYVWAVGPLFAGLWGTSVAHFVAHLALGWTIFSLMSTVITQSTTTLFGARAFIMDGRMRLTDFVLRCLAKSVFHFLMAIPALVIALAIYPPGLHVVGVLVGLGGFALVVVNTFLVGVVFSLVGARYPDIHELIGNILRVIYFLTPILWYPSQMPAGSLRGIASRLNPFFHLIEIFRAPVLGEPISIYSWYYVGALTVVGMAVAAFMYRRYARLVPIWL
jgi:ABC-type polysaccharide/polyol phosphate export permease